MTTIIEYTEINETEIYNDLYDIVTDEDVVLYIDENNDYVNICGTGAYISSGEILKTFEPTIFRDFKDNYINLLTEQIKDSLLHERDYKFNEYIFRYIKEE